MSPASSFNEPAWRVAGAAVQGSSHQKKGDIPCQDAVGYLVTREGLLLVALADGAGTAERAAEGAQTAVQAALSSLCDAFEQEMPADETGWLRLMAGCFWQARLALEDLAQAEGLPLKAFASTLACAVVSDLWLVAGGIGDGAVIAGTEAGELFSAVRPQRGEYANETYFLTQADALEHLDIYIDPQPFVALAVLSDGLTRLALRLSDHSPHLPFFGPLLSFVARADDEVQASEQLAAFLASERVCARTDDDKSVVLAVRADFSFEPNPASQAGEAESAGSEW